MLTTIQLRVWNCIGMAAFAIVSVPNAQAQERSNLQLLEALSSSLHVASPAEVKAAQEGAHQVLNRLRMELSQQAVGVVLTKELQLDRLAAELQGPAPDPATLDAIRRSLRRNLPGKVQETVNELRASVVRLIQLRNSSSPQLQLAHEAIGTINAHLANPQLRTTPEGGAELRQAFGALAAMPTSPADIQQLRERLSIANYATLIKKPFLVEAARRSFERPIQFQDCKEGTSISGQGTYRVDLSLEIPPSQNENLLVLHASGSGRIDAWASRNRVRASARACPEIHGLQPVHILPEKIIADPPRADARLRTQLTNVRMSGMLGRCRLLLRVISRAIESRLAANDSTVARQIEQVTRTRVEEEAYDLAHRINGLLQHGVWERILALDFAPAVRSSNDSEGVRSQTNFVHSNQLGALTAPPPIPAANYPQLDLVTWVHESAANNVFESLGPIHLHEETVRALWQVQFKLTSDAWEQLQPPRIPAVITLADQSPLELRLDGQSVQVTLRATACEVDGRAQEVAPCKAVVRYRIESDSSGLRFDRGEIVFADALSDSDAATWKKVLTLFFPESMRPRPKFHNTSFSQFLQLGYLNIDDGWLVVGAKRFAEPAASPLQSAKGTVQ